jgi:hypothetical protein
MVEVLIAIKYLQHLTRHSELLLDSSKTLASAACTYISRGNADYENSSASIWSATEKNQFTIPR